MPRSSVPVPGAERVSSPVVPAETPQYPPRKTHIFNRTFRGLEDAIPSLFHNGRESRFIVISEVLWLKIK